MSRNRKYKSDIRACDVESSFVIQAADGQESNVVAFDAVAYSGGKLYVEGFAHPVVVDLRGTLIRGANGSDQQIPVTLDHKDDRRVGMTRLIRNDNSKIVMAGDTNAETSHRDEVVNSARTGYKWAFSIEGHVRRGVLVKAGQQRHINGRTHDGPFIHATKFILRKVSAVTAGGDEDNVVRIAAAMKETAMDQGFKNWLDDHDVDPAELPDVAVKSLEATYKSERDAEAVPVVVAATDDDETPDFDPTAIKAQIRAAAADEMKRIAQAQTIFSDEPELCAKAINEEWDQTKCELEAMKAQFAKAPAAHFSDNGDVQVNSALECSLARRAGIKEEYLKEDYDEKTLEASLSKRYRGASIHEVMYHTCQRAGRYTRVGVVNDEFIRAALEADQELKAADSKNNLRANSGFSTIGLSAVLSNIANKTLLQSYQAYPMIATQICGTNDVTDFKEVSMYRVTTEGLLLKLGPSGEIKNTEITATEFKAKIDTYARMLAIDRRMLIDDDLGAFTMAAGQFGRIAAKTIDFHFHDTLINNSGSFFTGANSITGPDLDVPTMIEAETKFMDQVDDAGHPTMIMPGRLLVSNANKTSAERLFNEQRMDATGSTDSVVFVNNPHAGKYTPITSPWLNKTTLFAGANDVTWYLMADPGELSAMLLSFLRGQRNPTVEQSQTDFNTLGVQWRAYHDFGINFHDAKAAVKVG